MEEKVRYSWTNIEPERLERWVKELPPWLWRRMKKALTYNKRYPKRVLTPGTWMEVDPEAFLQILEKTPEGLRELSIRLVDSATLIEVEYSHPVGILGKLFGITTSTH